MGMRVWVCWFEVIKAEVRVRVKGQGQGQGQGQGLGLGQSQTSALRRFEVGSG